MAVFPGMGRPRGVGPDYRRVSYTGARELPFILTPGAEGPQPFGVPVTCLQGPSAARRERLPAGGGA